MFTVFSHYSDKEETSADSLYVVVCCQQAESGAW